TQFHSSCCNGRCSTRPGVEIRHWIGENNSVSRLRLCLRAKPQAAYITRSFPMKITLGAAAALLLALPLQADDKPPPKTYAIPYKLTFTNHIMVRAKINGKGPFNFIVDTGAPALFVATDVAKKVGATTGSDDWGTFDRFEVEGGLVLEKAKGKIA